MRPALRSRLGSSLAPVRGFICRDAGHDIGVAWSLFPRHCASYVTKMRSSMRALDVANAQEVEISGKQRGVRVLCWNFNFGHILFIFCLSMTFGPRLFCILKLVCVYNF